MASGENGGVESPSGSRLEPEFKPWQRFSSWVHAVCIVTFDLELGQAMELVYPSNAKLSEEDKTSICYLAFPDSNSGCMGDTKFHFRYKHVAPEPLSAAYLKYNSLSPVSLNVQAGYLYGYVYFRQVKDSSVPRGYLQKSVIVLSKLPFVSLFLEVVSALAPEFFAHGPLGVEAACHDVDQWPAPEPGAVLSLPLLGQVLQVQVPGDSQTAMLSPAPAPSVLPSVYLNNLYTALAPCLYHVHLLWELVLTGEPILVMTNSPETCSQLVHALITMIMPLRYCAEYRPYFTIHDHEFKEYTKTTQPPPPIILGVTNPFFSKTLQHWPHVIKLTEPPSTTSSLQKHKVRKGVLKAFDSKAGVYTQYEPFLQKDKAILKKLFKGVQTGRPEEVQGALLRRHLLELTQSFIIPLERYMGTLMPLHKNISPYKAPPTPWPFNPDTFISSLDKSGPQLTSGVKGNWTGLYRRFLKSPNFEGWYKQRYKCMVEKLQVLQLEALSEADLSVWLTGKGEVEVVDMLLKIRSKLADCKTHNIKVSDNIQRKLTKKMDDIMRTLPEDMRSVLKTVNDS